MVLDFDVHAIEQYCSTTSIEVCDQRKFLYYLKAQKVNIGKIDIHFSGCRKVHIDENFIRQHLLYYENGSFRIHPSERYSNKQKKIDSIPIFKN